MPKVSVVVTTYNRQELLKETLLSILDQTFTDFELIVVDNFSNYDFIGFIQSLNDFRIKPYQNANDGIIAVNRNYGIKQSSAGLIALCDDDDVWEPAKLQVQVDLMENNPGLDLCCTGASYINLKSKETNSKRIKNYLRNLLLSFNMIPAKYLLIFLHYITNSSVLFRRSVTESIGWINESVEIRTIEDYEYWFRAVQGQKMAFINQKLVRYRLHENQLSLGDVNINKRTLKVVEGHLKNLNGLQKFIYRIVKAQNSA